MCNKLYLTLAIFLLSGSSIATAFADDFEINGFLDMRYGIRENSTTGQERETIKETRLQLKTEEDFNDITFNLSLDLKKDFIENTHTDLASGQGYIDIRQLNFMFYPADDVDIKVGRQILTWGTTDLLFINDLFPKDFKSFFVGRDDEYLKAPSDAIKVSYFPAFANIDFIYVPRFNPDRYISGERLSFYDPTLQVFRESNNPIIVNRKNNWFNDDEIALRISRHFGNVEAAIYYYQGFWKSPSIYDVEKDQWDFSPLEVIGASIRTPLANGIFNIEIGQYKSNHAAKTDPLSRNSELRFLIGFEREVAMELTASVQYYIEKKLNYPDYLNSFSNESDASEKYSKLITLRLTKLMMQQNFTLSLVNIYSTTDNDGYIKLALSYKFSDRLKVDTGWNRFIGSQPKGTFSGLKRNSNFYAGIRFSF